MILTSLLGVGWIIITSFCRGGKLENSTGSSIGLSPPHMLLGILKNKSRRKFSSLESTQWGVEGIRTFVKYLLCAWGLCKVLRRSFLPDFMFRGGRRQSKHAESCSHCGRGRGWVVREGFWEEVVFEGRACWRGGQYRKAAWGSSAGVEGLLGPREGVCRMAWASSVWVVVMGNQA